MPTREEIERRVQQYDTPLSAKRSAAAQQVSDIAQRRAEIAEQLADIERQLGDVLADATAVMTVDELAQFTDVPAADLAAWLAARKTTRGKRKKPANTTPAARQGKAQETPPAAEPEAAGVRLGAADASARIAAPAS